MTEESEDSQQAAATDGPPSTPANVVPIAEVDARFLQNYDKIYALAAKQHRRLRGHLKQEAIQETLAYTMQAFRDLTDRGADPVELLPSVVRFASLRWYEHARFAGNLSAKDVYSHKARGKTGHFLTSLPDSEDDEVADEVRAAMRARTANPAEAAIVRADYEAFLDSLTPKQREITEALESGLNMNDIAAQRGVSKTAIQDVRNTVARKWTEREGYEKSLER